MSEVANYYNGTEETEVINIDSLSEISSEFAESIATGPQDEFLELLDRFNRYLPDNQKIAVTPAWNWKPGTYDKFREYLISKLQINKRPQDLTHLINRTHDNARFNINRIANTIEALESRKWRLKSDGYKIEVDIDEFKKTMKEIVDRIQSQSKLVEEITGGRVTIRTYIGNETSRYTKIYSDIILKDLSMEVYQGDSKIHTQPLEIITIKSQMLLRKFINAYQEKNNMWQGLNFKGLYESELVTNRHGDHYQATLFPYISRAYWRNGRPDYSNVCLDRYNDDVKKAYANIDFVNMGMQLMEWAQFYSTNYSHPYNSLGTMHIGLPDSYSKAYKAIVADSAAMSNCLDTIAYKNEIQLNYHWTSKEEVESNLDLLINNCDKMDCVYRHNGCSQYGNNINKLRNFHNRVVDSDIGYMIESLLGYCFAEGLIDTYNFEDSFGISIRHKPIYESETGIILSRLYYAMLSSIDNENLLNSSMYNYLKNYTTYWSNAKEEAEIILTEEEQKEALMRFATGSN